MVTHAWVSYIDKAVDNNMTCSLHDNCGKVVTMGMPILVDATECELVEGHVYYIAARVLNRNGTKACKVGIVKCLIDQVHYFAHRVGYVTEIQHPVNMGDNLSIFMRNKCVGVAKIVFSDTGRTKHEPVEKDHDIIGYFPQGNI